MKYSRDRYQCPYCGDNQYGLFARLRLIWHMMCKHDDMYVNNEWID